jgi:hypothetical protein
VVYHAKLVGCLGIVGGWELLFIIDKNDKYIVFVNGGT